MVHSQRRTQNRNRDYVQAHIDGQSELRRKALPMDDFVRYLKNCLVVSGYRFHIAHSSPPPPALLLFVFVSSELRVIP